MAFYDVIRYEPSSMNYLLYKHPVDEFNNQSKLIVSPGQVAFIVHNGKIEKILEDGTFRINSELLPFLKGFTKAFFGGKNPYPIEIYFLNKRLKLDMFWGTSDPIKLIDPKYSIQINVRARGQMGIKLRDYQYFYQTLVGTIMKGNMITYDILHSFFRGKINQIVKKQLSSYILNNKITFFEIDTHIDEIQKVIKDDLTDDMFTYGFDILDLSVESINVPDDDLNKLNDILHKKAEYEQLGDTVYRTTRGYDVLEAGAENNSAMGTMMGIGMGMGVNSNNNNGFSTIIPPSEQAAPNPKPATVKCPKCGKDNPADAKFCSDCGNPFVHTCPNCGHSVNPGQKFCSECGQSLVKKGE